MKKAAQSLLDIFNLLSRDGVNLFRPPINNKEARVLYSLWKDCSRDEYGRVVVTGNIDPFILQELNEKRIIAIRDTRLAGVKSQVLADITDRGQEIIRQIILYGEHSSLEKNDRDIDYEKIYTQMKLGPSVKVAKK